MLNKCVAVRDEAGILCADATAHQRLSGAHVGKQKSSLEINYRIILETFLEDQIEVLYFPEFPAAAISLGMTARTLVS